MIALLVDTTNSGIGFLARLLGRYRYQADWRVLRTSLSSALNEGQSISLASITSIQTALVVSEDRRFFRHRGVDAYSIGRAIWRALRGGRIEGASTITQQLVRVYTNDYRFNLRRKIKEISLSALVDQHFSKDDQVRLYLLRAYFGWGMIGIRQAIHRLKINEPCSLQDAAQLVARLKYPEPKASTKEHAIAIQSRIEHILKLCRGRAK